MTSPDAVESHASTLTRLALRLVDALDPEQREAVRGSLDDSDRRRWTYLPGDRPGLSLEHLSPQQRRHVDDLLVATHGELGANLAVGAVEIERVRRRLATGTDDIGGDRYWIRVLGDPAGGEPWGWQINGHHLGMHAVLVGDTVTLTPHFVGAEPARVPTGPEEGRRLLGP
ncbi:MAG: DUF3500 domain-containing protein, partial [Nocardioides sp.]